MAHNNRIVHEYNELRTQEENQAKIALENNKAIAIQHRAFTTLC
jgi:hypothetical protein